MRGTPHIRAVGGPQNLGKTFLKYRGWNIRAAMLECFRHQGCTLPTGSLVMLAPAYAREVPTLSLMLIAGVTAQGCPAMAVSGHDEG
jgi:hypothetical protein